MSKLLIVDDESIERETIRYFVESASLPFTAILEADNGRDALETSKAEQPDVILSDIKMPVCSGTEFVKQLRETGLDAVVIFSTAYNYFEYAVSAIKLGAFDFILKPISKDVLLEVLEKALCSRMGKIEAVSPEIAEVKKYIEIHYLEKLSLDDIADRVGFSKYHLSRIFKQATGYTIFDYITMLRMNDAKELLARKNMSVKEIGALLGYCDPNYFTCVFKKEFDVSPTEFRHNALNKNY